MSGCPPPLEGCTTNMAQSTLTEVLLGQLGFYSERGLFVDAIYAVQSVCATKLSISRHLHTVRHSIQSPSPKKPFDASHFINVEQNVL